MAGCLQVVSWLCAVPVALWCRSLGWLQYELLGRPLEGPFPPSALFLAYLGQCGSAVGGPCPAPWAEGEGDCARPPVVPVLAVPRKSQPEFSVSTFVPALLPR